MIRSSETGGSSSSYLEKERDRLLSKTRTKPQGRQKGMPAAGTGESDSGSDNEPFYWEGLKKQKYHGRNDVNPITGAPRPFNEPSVRNVATRGNAATALYEFDTAPLKKQRAIGRRLAKAGLISVEPRMGETLDEYLARVPINSIRSAYERAVEFAMTPAMVNKGITLNGAIDRLGKANEEVLWDKNGNPGAALTSAEDSRGGGKGGGSKGKIPGRKYTSVSKSVDIYRKDDVEMLVRDVIGEVLGRTPTEEEIADFKSVLNQESRENPSVSRTTTIYDEDGTANTRTRGSGGLTEGAINATALDWAEDQPGAAEWQAMGTYLPALLNALSATVPGASAGG